VYNQLREIHKYINASLVIGELILSYWPYFKMGDLEGWFEGSRGRASTILKSFSGPGDNGTSEKECLIPVLPAHNIATALYPLAGYIFLSTCAKRYKKFCHSVRRAEWQECKIREKISDLSFDS
jgi:hypothetical protein